MAMVKFSQGTPVVINTDISSDFKITPAQLDSVLNDKTKMFIFSNPCNPSGSVYTESELRALANVFEKYPNCFIVSDEIYELINFESSNFSIAKVESIKDRVITVNGVAKGFAMTGWRIGYIGAPLKVAKACTKLQGQFTSGANSIAQKAAIAAVNADPAKVSEMKNIFLKRRDLMISKLKEVPGLTVNEPTGAFYLFPDVKNIIERKGFSDDVELSEYLIESANVAVVPGSAFGPKGYIRLSYATSLEQIKDAIERISKSLT